MEAVGIVRYQPHPKWTATARLIYWQNGLDSANSNFGGNIFKLNSTRSGDYGYSIPSGVKATGVNAHLAVSFEVKENLFLDASVLLRKYTVDENPTLNRDANVITAGVRMNVFRREYDY
jgi:hypothetical protein